VKLLFGYFTHNFTYNTLFFLELHKSEVSEVTYPIRTEKSKIRAYRPYTYIYGKCGNVTSLTSLSCDYQCNQTLTCEVSGEVR
jgi:hypothetical protein